MEKNSLWKHEEKILRVLKIQREKILVIDCIRRSMPVRMDKEELKGDTPCTEETLWEATGIRPCELAQLPAPALQFVHTHFSMIAGILPFLDDETERSRMIRLLAERCKVSRQTVRSYLCLYLAYQDMSVFAPKQRKKERELTTDEKNMRWALRKFYYTRKNVSLSSAYTQMLKERYCDGEGNLLPEHPSMHQFRYFYRKHRKLRDVYISRDGKSAYQRNRRPLLGDGVQAFAPAIGVGMLDATVCDIYLVNEAGQLVGRPILTACIDAYSSLCLGYFLSWEGGLYSLRGLMQHVIADKEAYCRRQGIVIDKKDWDCAKLPATLVTDMGREYVSGTFSQITELGVRLIHLPAYRPELKGPVEKFFDLVQESFKPILKGKGVIEPDFQERGSHDYRRDACLTLADFEKVILRCVLFYNTSRILERFPYTEEMLEAGIRPHAADIWNYGKTQPGADLIAVLPQQLRLVLLPRTEGKFTKAGLNVNRMRYRNKDYVERYLTGETATVAYDPQDVGAVWMLEDGAYIRFDLIEGRYAGKDLAAVQGIQEGQRQLIRTAKEEQIQEKIALASHIEEIAALAGRKNVTDMSHVRKNRKKEQARHRSRKGGEDVG